MSRRSTSSRSPRNLRSYAPPVLFERGEEEEEVGRREPEDMGRLEPPAAPVLIDTLALKEVDEFGMTDIEAAIDNFADDGRYDSGHNNWTYFAPEEETEIINALFTLILVILFDSEYVPEQNAMMYLLIMLIGVDAI